jgi:hypothetical protein
VRNERPTSDGGGRREKQTADVRRGTRREEQTADVRLGLWVVSCETRATLQCWLAEILQKAVEHHADLDQLGAAKVTDPR